ncbi:unnamed protein product [Calicophoron daubneyi]|uniref:Proteasome activator complex subunit 3 n=1 Tax=Calicophoron daubneyi TaxID=300641 RepID=A0AAV2T3T6_CALDB
MSVSIGDYLRSYFTREAEQRLSEGIPTKIRELDDLLKEDIFDLTSGTRRVKRSTEKTTNAIDEHIKGLETVKNQVPLSIPVTPNEALEQAYRAVRPFMLQLIEDAQVLRMWVQLNIPRIEDGNNFGVSVQEEVIMETAKTEMDASSMLDLYGDYLMYRAKIATKVCKWPTVSDYRQALIDADEGAYIRLRMNAREIRNHYGRLYDGYQKNGAKLRSPRIPVATNEVLDEIYDVIRPFMIQLIEDAQVLRAWVQLNIPRIEDGNNFGVAVQEEVIYETNRTAMNVALTFYRFEDYLMHRAKIARKICKWPTISDYRRALIETDEGLYILLRKIARDLRNHFARLLDIYQKNDAKLRSPRNEAENQINMMY